MSTLKTRLTKIEAAMKPRARTIDQLTDAELDAGIALLTEIIEAEKAGESTEALRRELEITLRNLVFPPDKVAEVRAMSEEALDAEIERLAAEIESTSGCRIHK